MVPAALLALTACGGEEDPAPTGATAPAASSSSASSPSSVSSPSSPASASTSSSPTSGSEASAESPAPTASAAPESGSASASGTDVALDITSLQDLEGIQTKVDSLTSQEACGYLQGALANPVSMEHPAVGAQGVRDLASVSPDELSCSFEGLAALMSTSPDPADPALGAQFSQVDKVCLATVDGP